MDVLKLTGFSETAKVPEILEFLKQVKTTETEAFFSLERTGQDRNKFNGTVFIVSKSKFDTSSIYTLRNRRFQHNFINVSVSSAEEFGRHSLFPKPRPEFFEMIKNQFDQYGTHSSTNPSLEANEAPNDPLVGVTTDGRYNNGTSIATVMPVDPIAQHQKNLVMKNVPDKYIPSIIKTNDTNDISKDIQECLMAYKKGAFQDLLEIHYGYFVKIFYLDPTMEDDDIVSFVAHICRPIFVMHSYFEGGPHAGKKRGEVFLCFQSTSNAYKCLKLNGSRIGKHKVAIIFPSREEIDSVLCQNGQFYNITNTQTQEQEEIQTKENTQTKLETTKNEEINPALKLLQTVTESINQNQQRYSLESSMADNIDTSFNEQLFKKMNVEIRSDVVTEAMVRAKNVPNSATLKDMINFFRSVPFVHSSLKKLNSVGDKAEWSLTFKTHKDAIDSINALNYRLIKENPIELEFI